MSEKRTESARAKVDQFWGAFWVFVGTFVLLVNLGVLSKDAWRFWPVAVILFGLFKILGLGKEENK